MSLATFNRGPRQQGSCFITVSARWQLSWKLFCGVGTLRGARGQGQACQACEGCFRLFQPLLPPCVHKLEQAGWAG